MLRGIFHFCVAPPTLATRCGAEAGWYILNRRDETNRNSGRCRGPMSSGRDFPIRSFIGSVVLVAVAAGSVYLSYELVVKPRQALQDQIREQKGTILKLEQEKQRLEAYLKILKNIDRRARIEVLRSRAGHSCCFVGFSLAPCGPRMASSSTRRARYPRSTRSGKRPTNSRRTSGNASGTLPTMRNWRRSAACGLSTAMRLTCVWSPTGCTKSA